MAAQKSIIIVNRESLEINLLDRKPLKLSFSEKAVDNLEVKELTHFQKEITKLLIAENIKPQKVIIALSEDIQFTKTVTAKSEEEKEKALTEFLAEIPFEPNTLVSKFFEETNGSKIIAVNNSIFTKLIDVLSELKWKVTYVIPAQVLGDIKKIDIEHIFKNKKILEIANLYTFENKEIKSWKKVVLGLFITLLLAVGAFFALKNIEVSKKIAEESSQSENLVIVDTSLATEEEVELPAIAKEEITIQIQNGTGIEEETKIITEILSTEGFSNMEVGISGVEIKEAAEIIFWERVPEEYIEQIGNILKNRYENIIETPYRDSDTINFDIVILTGKLLN